MIFIALLLVELYHVVIFYMSIHFLELCFVFLKGAYTLKRQYFKNAFFHLQPFCTISMYLTCIHLEPLHVNVIIGEGHSMSKT